VVHTEKYKIKREVELIEQHNMKTCARLEVWLQNYWHGHYMEMSGTIHVLPQVRMPPPQYSMDMRLDGAQRRCGRAHTGNQTVGV
jgi:hypothetical protein